MQRVQTPGRSGMPSEERILEVEKATKNFMQMEYEQNKLFTKTMEEQFAMLKNISHQIGNLNREISGLQVKISNAEISISAMSEAQSSLINRMAAKPKTIDNKPFAATNAIQVELMTMLGCWSNCMPGGKEKMKLLKTII